VGEPDEERDEESLGGRLQAARPNADRLAMERSRSRAAEALFGRVEAPRIGRFTILQRIAGGGMGVVYGAYDPELERRVALKVLQPFRISDERSRKRLAAEARTLARLDHPNVVKVHDVLTFEDQTVVVMELVDGETLASWQTEERGWRECVTYYLQAADGLAAAHGVDVIHRDFKPSNAIIGTDGRVRVLDFGLARLGPDEVPSGGDSSELSLTQTGDMIGTLGYASPEQLRGERLTPASDQFSFCVSLHHAVEGSNPFVGATVSSRLASMAGAPAFSDRRVPAWLRTVIERGLSLDPARRYPKLADLAAELRRTRGWRRYRIPALATTVAAVSVGITLNLQTEPAVAPVVECDGGSAEVGRIWNPRARDAISRTLGASAVTSLDTYVATWSDAHRAACNDHRRGVTSEKLLDRRMLCLEQRLGDLGAAVDVLGKMERDSLFRAFDVLARIPATSRCSDLERLQAEVEPPDPVIRDRVTMVQGQISRAEALSRAGRSVAAQQAAREATAGAKQTSYAPLEVEAALAESRILISQRQLRAAIVPLEKARRQALGLKLYAPAVEAAARLIYVEGMDGANQASLEKQIEYLLPLASGSECDHFVRPLLLNNIGAVYLAIGRRDLALEYFQRAKKDLGGYAPIDLELTVIDRNLAMVTPDYDTRVSLATSVWNRLRDALGESHPATLEALVVYVQYVADPAIAYDLLLKAIHAYERHHPTMRDERGLAELHLAFLARERGEHALAMSDYERAVRTLSEKPNPDLDISRHFAVGELALERGDLDTAEKELAPVSLARLHAEPWYQRSDGLRATIDLGLIELARHHDAIAARHFEAATAGLASIAAVNEEVIHRQLEARARYELGRILDRRGDPRRGSALVKLGVGFYRAASETSYRWLIERNKTP